MKQAREDFPLGLLIMMLGSIFRERFYEGYSRAGFGDLRPPHKIVFDLLSPDGDRVVDLAKKAKTSKQAIGYLVAYLEEHGYLERVPDPRDGRAQIVRRTARGWEVSGLERHVMLEIQDEWAAQFGEQNMEQLIVLMRELIKSIGTVGDLQPKTQNS